MSEYTVTGTLKAGRREWIGLTILVLPTLLISIDMTITYLALPAISAALRPSGTELLWITDIYGFLEAGLLIVMGTLGDRIGVRKLLLTGGTAFGLASVLAAFSTSPLTLILARGVLGIAGATILPSTLSMIRNLFHDDVQRTFAMGLYTTCFSSGTMLGPMIGGFLLSHYWWGSVFLVAVPIILLLVILGPLFLPEFRDVKSSGRIDLRSAVLLILGALAIILGIKQAAQFGPGWASLLFLLAGALAAWLFLHRQRELSDPLIDLQLFRKSNFNLSLVALMVGLFSWAGIFFFVGQYLQLVAGLDPFHAGLWTMPAAGGSILLCMLAPVLVKRVKRGYLMLTGLVVLGIGIGLIGQMNVHSFFLLILATVLMSGGCGLVVTLGIDMVVASAPPERAGAAAGISETSTGYGSSIGIALLGSFWTFLYRAQMGKVIPAWLPKEDAETVKGSLGGALKVGGKWAGVEGEALIRHAREAFVHSLNITAVLCALLVLLVAVLAAPGLKRAG